jgi:glycosyltransferase involved in cell wall biosynthesis
VSSDSAAIARDPLVGNKIVAHLVWDPEALNFEKSKQLADALQATGIELAHFHFGGNYAWGSRLFNLCPVLHVVRLGIPCVATNHGVFGVFDGYIGPQRSWLTKLALLPAAWFSKLQVLSSLEVEIAVSQNDYRALRRRYWPLRRRFTQIYHSRIHERERVEARDRKKVVLCAGTLGPRKGQPYLAQAFARIASDFPDWELVFIGRPGDPRTAEELNGLLKGSHLRNRARWLSACSDDELKQWLQSVEIFAMPSMHEGLGLSLQEALYYGCACIATRIGGIPDLIQDQDNGILVERANVDELASGLARLMADGALRQRFRSRAHDSVVEKEMTAEGMVARYANIYRKVINR